MSQPKSDGTSLEAKVQRLFLAQGLFAERGLRPSATADRRMLATDIDVLVSEYASGFHLTRRHAECKSGKIPLLDRILWLSGVRALLGADASYLVGADLDLEASDFGRSLHIQLLTLKHVEAWEASLAIPPDAWPCRSDLQLYGPPRDRWRKLSSEQNADEMWRFLREALAFVEIESWLSFRYRHLNKTFRLFETLATKYQGEGVSHEQDLCSRYIFGALLVRLSQQLLAVCLDVTTVLPADVKKYLLDRLIFGDQDPALATGLIQRTVDWIDRALRDKGAELPPSVDVSRLAAPPSYGEEFVQLIHRLIVQSNDARYLPVAMEVSEFGHDEIEQKLPRLRAAAAAADGLAALVRGFVIRAFSIPSKLAEPIGRSLVTEPAPQGNEQLKLRPK